MEKEIIRKALNLAIKDIAEYCPCAYVGKCMGIRCDSPECHKFLVNEYMSKAMEEKK